MVSVVPSSDNALLTVKYEPQRPVELLDLTASLHALGSRYRDYANESGFDPEADIGLYIDHLRSGSIIATLKTLSDQYSFVHDHLDLLAGFIANWNEAAQFFLALVPYKFSPPVTKVHAEQLSQFLEPVAKDGGSQVFLSINSTAPVTVNNFHFNSQQASAAQNNIRRFIGKQPSQEEFFQNEVLYLRQASGDFTARAGDKGVIEKFSNRAVRLRFMNDDAKKAVIDTPENPFKMAFIVDGKISTVEGKPALYQIYVVHDVFERP